MTSRKIIPNQVTHLSCPFACPLPETLCSPANMTSTKPRAMAGADSCTPPSPRHSFGGSKSSTACAGGESRGSLCVSLLLKMQQCSLKTKQEQGVISGLKEWALQIHSLSSSRPVIIIGRPYLLKKQTLKHLRFLKQRGTEAEALRAPPQYPHPEADS